MLSKQRLKSVLLSGNSQEEKRAEIKKNFLQTYELYEKLFECIKNDKAYFKKSNRLRHPLIFYYAHTAVFFVNKLMLLGVLKKPLNQHIEATCAIGVDEMSWDDLDEKNYNWPSISDVKKYRDDVKNIVLELIETLPLSLPISWNSEFWIILMGIEHEKIHFETSSVLIRELPIADVQTHKDFTICKQDSISPKNEMITIEKSKITLGKEKDSTLYGWDNEYGVHEVDIDEFQASKFLVSNKEFLEFVEAKGYENINYWSDEGWKWREFTSAVHPVFWQKNNVNSEYQLRTMLELVPMMWSWPADVNCHEAEAFCKYKSEQTNQNISLPSEAQYMKIRELSEVQDEPEWEKANANINMEYFASSTPVDMFKHNDFYDVIGNVWQWTTTPISGYDGFKVHPIYDDFSVPTFDGKHNMIKGGSWSSTGNLATKQARYAFRKHFFQHAGLRYIIGKNNMKQQESNIYETDTLVSQYCAFQYGKEYFGVENFAKACARKAIKYSKNTKTALDLGCATGRASFELAQVFDEVTGIDFSARFIQVASKLADKETILYSECEQGDIITKNSCSLQSLGLETSNVKFWQGDACNLKPQFTGYDLLMATNLIDRLYKPYLFLDNVYKRVNDGGVLILTSPYTWLEEYTKKEYWIGGKVSNNKDIYAIDELKQILGKHFKLEHTEDVPFVIKETSRKYQHTISQMSVWTKI